jgi:hypothetical protein
MWGRRFRLPTPLFLRQNDNAIRFVEAGYLPLLRAAVGYKVAAHGGIAHQA